MVSTQRITVDWRIVAYMLAGVALLLLIVSFVDGGSGMFGWGFMMAGMWVWMLLGIFALVLLGYFLGQQGRQGEE